MPRTTRLSSNKRSRFLFLKNFRSFCGNSSKKIRFWSSIGRSGSSGKSIARRCQNSSLLRRLATTKTSKKRFGKKLIFLGFGNLFFVNFLGFWVPTWVPNPEVKFKKPCFLNHLGSTWANLGRKGVPRGPKGAKMRPRGVPRAKN